MDRNKKLQKTPKRRRSKRNLSSKGSVADDDDNSPALKIGILKTLSRRERRLGRRKLLKGLDSIITELSYQKIETDKTPEPKNSQIPTLNQTIDLCDDSMSENLHCASESKENADVLIQCVKDTRNRSEVIDLTVTPKLSDNCEPTVIDLSVEEDCGGVGRKSDINDEISIIGTYSKVSHLGMKPKRNLDYIPLSCKSSRTNNLLNISGKVKKKYLKKKSKFPTDNNKNFCRKKFADSLIPNPGFAGVGENIYCSSPVDIPKDGLRPVIIDGSNVAFVHSNNQYYFSCKRLEICIKYFKEKGHKVTAFVPQFRTKNNKSDNPQLLRKLELQGDVILTPSKEVDGKNIVPYDDRFIVQTAVLKGGIIVSRDNYNDLLRENPAWADTIKYRTLAFTWVDDVLIFPKDPLGEHGPSLQEFLRF